MARVLCRLALLALELDLASTADLRNDSNDSNDTNDTNTTTTQTTTATFTSTTTFSTTTTQLLCATMSARMPPVMSGVSCASTLEPGEQCQVKCPEGYNTQGYFTCLEGLMVGTSFCMENSSSLIVEQVTKVAGSFQVDFAVPSALESQGSSGLETAFTASIAAAISLSTDYVQRVVVAEIGLGGGRRLATVKTFEVLYELLVPSNSTGAELVQLAADMTSTSTSEYASFAFVLTQTYGASSVSNMVPVISPASYADEVQTLNDGSIVDIFVPAQGVVSTELNPNMPCSTLACPSGYTQRWDAETVFCQQGICALSSDLSLCCLLDQFASSDWRVRAASAVTVNWEIHQIKFFFTANCSFGPVSTVAATHQDGGKMPWPNGQAYSSLGGHGTSVARLFASQPSAWQTGSPCSSNSCFVGFRWDTKASKSSAGKCGVQSGTTCATQLRTYSASGGMPIHCAEVQQGTTPGYYATSLQLQLWDEASALWRTVAAAHGLTGGTAQLRRGCSDLTGACR